MLINGILLCIRTKVLPNNSEVLIIYIITLGWCKWSFSFFVNDLSKNLPESRVSIDDGTF